MSAPVVFAEIHGADGPALRRFYTGLFGWAFDGMLADPEGHLIGLVAPPAGRP
jgi:predicted enzyme related to lactoylglutathione lyase